MDIKIKYFFLKIVSAIQIAIFELLKIEKAV